MKINKMGSSNVPVVPDQDGTSKTEKNSSPFTSELLKIQDGNSKERLNGLLEQINAQGKRLGQVPTYSELKGYRELVRKFIGEAVGRMYTLNSQTGWDQAGRKKMYTIIKEVDHQLAGMAEDVRLGQERQLDILSKHDAIRGMLIDLYT